MPPRSRAVIPCAYMTDLQALLAAVDDARDEIVDLLQQLVRLPTVNTGPRPDTGNEAVVCDLLREKLQRDHVEFEVHESAPGRGNLIARMGQPGGRRMLLMSHTDVVPVED
jgi:succinyl-diaminopimelate desuccinylase